MGPSVTHGRNRQLYFEVVDSFAVTSTQARKNLLVTQTIIYCFFKPMLNGEMRRSSKQDKLGMSKMSILGFPGC